MPFKPFSDAPVAVISCVCAVIVNGVPRLSFPRTRIGTRKAIRCSLRRPTRPPQIAPSLCKPPVAERYVQRSFGILVGQEGRLRICIGVNSKEILPGTDSETIPIPAGV